MRFQSKSTIALLALGLVLAGPASATVTTVTNICDGVNTVRVVSLALNNYEYFFQTLPSGAVHHFNGILVPTSTSKVRLFNLPAGRYRMTYKLPNSTPIGTYGPDVVVRPFSVVNGMCVYTDTTRRR